MGRVEVGRIESPRGRQAAERDVVTPAARDRRVISDRRLGVGVRTERAVSVEAGRPGSGPRRHVENGAEFQAVLRRIRALDEVDEGEIVEIDLAADVPVQLLRQRHTVDLIVDDPVVAVDVNDAVRAPEPPRASGSPFG